MNNSTINCTQSDQLLLDQTLAFNVQAQVPLCLQSQSAAVAEQLYTVELISNPLRTMDRKPLTKVSEVIY